MSRYLLSSIFIAGYLSANHPVPFPQTYANSHEKQPIIIQNYIAGVHDARNQSIDVNTSNVASSSSVIKDIHISQKIKDSSAALLALLMPLLKNQHDDRSLLTIIASRIYAHKYKWTAGLLFTLWSYYSCKLKLVERNLMKKDNWSLWKNQYSLQNLYMMNDETLMYELLVTIQSRYTSLDNLEDFNTPLTSFIHDVDHEQKQLTAYAHLSSYIEASKCARFFPINKSLLEEVASRKERLIYLKSKLWSWVSMHKVDQRL